jgi:vacuolar-type H+-ATPase subunit D/Vma8
MNYFIRPSKEQLIKTREELKTVREFENILDERAQSLSKEINNLKKIIKEKQKRTLTGKIYLSNESKKALEKYGILGLKRISLTSKDVLRVSQKKDNILGVSYSFPEIKKTKGISYSINRTDPVIDLLYKKTSQFLETVIDLSKYKQAKRRLNKELISVRRKLNAIRNILKRDLEEKETKIKRYLAEKERYDWVIRKLVVDKIQS